MYESVRELIEPRVRHVVAEHLAVDSRALGDSLSLRDELAADSLDLLELALLLEREFGMMLPDRVVDGIRSYGDLVDRVVRLVVARSERDGRDGTNGCAPQVRACLIGSTGAPGSRHWAGLLTAYMATTLADATQQAGPGARLEIVVGAETSAVSLEDVRGHFVRTGARAIDVSVTRAAALAPLWNVRRERMG